MVVDAGDTGVLLHLFLVSIVLCQRLNGASILLGEGPKAALVQLARRKKSLEFGSISNVRTSSIISGCEQGEPRGRVVVVVVVFSH